MTNVPAPGDVFELFGVGYRVVSVSPYSDWTWEVEAVTVEPIAGSHEDAYLQVPSRELTN